MKHEIAPTSHDPQHPLAPVFRAQFVRVVLGGFSRAEATRLSSLPVARARTEMELMLANLGRTMTREECDGCLRDLALLLPRAGLDADDIERMLDLYHALLAERGIPARILQSAAKAYVMAPRKGKAKFFPDPGELAELCTEDMREHRQKLAALERGMEILNGTPDDPKLLGASRSAPTGSRIAVPAYDQAEDGPRKLPSIAEVLAKHGRSDTTPPPPKGPRPMSAEQHRPAAGMESARPSTDAGELRSALEKKTGKTVDQLQQINHSQ